MAEALHQIQHPAVAALADVLQALSRLSALRPPGLEQCMACSVDLDRLVAATRAAVVGDADDLASRRLTGERHSR